MPEFLSRQRPLASQSDLTPAERASVRRAVAVASVAFIGMFAVIAAVMVFTPAPLETIALLGP